MERRIDSIVDRFAAGTRALDDLPGFAGYTLATNRDKGKLTAISRWKTRADMESGDVVSDDVRDRLLAEKPQRIPLVDRYDIIAVRGVGTGIGSGASSA